MNFNWSDPLLLDNQLSEEERMVGEAARAFATDRLASRVARAFEEELSDPEIFREMGEQGLLGVTLPEEFGGVGANYVSYGLVAREIERVDSGYRSMMSVQSSLVIYPILEFGSEEQKQRYLPSLASGNRIGCFGLTEPDAGSDPGAMRTVATPLPGGGYVLNGTKTWISNAPIADVLLIWAKSKAHNGAIRGFIVDRGAAGLSTPKIDGKLSLRASITGMIQLDGVEVAEKALPKQSRSVRD